MDFIKYFQQRKKSTRTKETAATDNNKKKEILTPSPVNQQTEANPEQKQILQNLQHIKTIIDQPKENNPDARFSEINEHLGEEEYHQTVREERWFPTVFCPNCHSTNIERLAIEQQESTHNFRYLCKTCRSKFNDDSKTPFELGVPPLEVWIQCWFLVGCTDSLDYIAAKLHLDPTAVKQMIKELQKTFNAKQPLTRLMNYDKWAQQNPHYAKRIQAEILAKKDVLFRGETTNQPFDTAELRRQKERREDNADSNKPKNRNL